MWPQNTAFSPQLPTLQLYWDSTSLGLLKECARKYELAIVRGWRSRSAAVDLDFGIFLHSARERYYHARAAGAGHDNAQRAGLDWLLSATWNEQLNRPWQGDQFKNRFTLARTYVWYCEQWGARPDPLEQVMLANGRPAVEVSFRFELAYGPGKRAEDKCANCGATGFEQSKLGPFRCEFCDGTEGGNPPAREEWQEGPKYSLCGHLDRLVRFNGGLWVSDLKSTRHTLDASYFQQFSPDNQMSLYSLAGQVVCGERTSGIIIDAAQVAVGFSRFARGLVQRTEAQLEEWLRGLEVLLRQAEQYARANFWPQNDKACFRCQFRPICGKTPHVREQWLKADYERRTWDPLQVRGDI